MLPATASTVLQIACFPYSSCPLRAMSLLQAVPSSMSTPSAAVVPNFTSNSTNSYLPIGSNYRGQAPSDLLCAYPPADRLYDSLAFE